MSFHFQSFFISIITIYIFSFLLYSSVSFAHLDNIGPYQSISEGTSLVSKQGTFELGLFRPGNSTNRYLGIWFSKIPVQRVVWVANRCKPIIGSSGSLTVNDSGSLVLSYQNNKTIVVWSQSPLKRAQNPTLELLDSGNLVLRDENGDYLWQSFDYPSDTLLSGMKFGWDLKRGLNRNLSAWRNWDDPSHGGLVYGYEIADNRYPEAYMKRGNETVYRAGPWNGVGFSGSPEIRPNQLFNYSFVYDGKELYASYNLKNDSVVSIMVLNQTEGLQRLTWVEEEESFRPYARAPREVCDNYGLCGANGNCVISENPVCQCLKGFMPKNEEKWGLRNWSDGCVRNRPLNCKAKDDFFKVVELKMPDTRNTWLSDNTSLSECRELCLKNCFCTAYANSDIRGKGRGCRIWLSDLVDIRVISESGQDLYVRVSESEIADEKASQRRVREAIIVVAVGAVIIGGFVFSYCFFWKRMRGKKTTVQENSRATDEEDLELPLFKLETLVTATNNFSMSNKIGEGGFGPVYKGKLEDGQEIAVKRLSSSSRQGMNEFMNEVTIIAKLQHRNLVKVLGCCIHGEEKLLVYEYMPNKSLDLFIFGQGQSKLLEWSTRFRVICGIARGLTYLHQDSRLRIIHRDLKASNVLLDIEMNPKISDFGLARAFGGDQTEVNTNRIVGSYGYMAPEYAYGGLFSTKSDVFSFGTLVLETVSGKRSMSFHRENYGLTLIGHAWTLLKEGRATELIDMRLTDSNTDLQEVLRCIHIGLLCVQQRPIDRPNMSSVVLMLSSDESVLIQPKPPGYFTEIETQQGCHSPTYIPDFSTTNSMTMSLINGR